MMPRPATPPPASPAAAPPTIAARQPTAPGMSMAAMK